jgi:hypothetical protein
LDTDADRSRPAAIADATEIDPAGQRVNTEPTEAQKESGNYKKAHIKVAGPDTSIENPKGRRDAVLTRTALRGRRRSPPIMAGSSAPKQPMAIRWTCMSVTASMRPASS